MRYFLSLAFASSLAANPITVPYQNDFNDRDISDFFCPSGKNYNWGWDWTLGKMLHWVSASNRVTTATSEILQLGTHSATAEDFYMKVTVEPQTFSGGGSIGFGACGSTQTLSTFYLADVKPALNRIRILKVGGGNINLVAERNITGLSLTDLQPFDLELTGTYSGNSIDLELTVTKGEDSDSAIGTHSPALTGHHFGLRSYNTSGSFEVHYDHYEVRPLHTVPIIFLPKIIAPVGENYSYTPTSHPDITLTTSTLSSWLNFDGSALSGIPTQAGTHEITLTASTAEASESHTYTLIVPAPTDLVISEFMADNDDTLTDGDGDSSDWIELFNPTTSAIDLTNWSLTDDPAFPTKWVFPPGTVAPSLTKIIIFASGKDLSNHTNFSLGNASGNHLALHRPDGSIASAFPMYPKQYEDISYGLSGDYSSSGYLLDPTPASTNPGPSFSDFTADTTFSVDRGFFDAPFSTVINCDTPGATIAYTTDGTDPSPTNGTQISPGASVPVSSTTILRAAAFTPGLAPSNIDTQSYLFLSDIRTQSASAPLGWPSSSVNGQVFNYGMDPDITNSISVAEFEEAMKDIDTISMVTDLDNFVDPQNGIWVNAENRGPNWERPFSVELIKPDGSDGFQVDAGVRIRGGWSRRDPNPKHAFHLYFKEKYGDGKLRYPLFGLEGADEFDRLDLRATQGRSWHFSNSPDATFNRDGFARDLQNAMGQPYARSRYYHLYLNGVYFGIFQSQERTDKFYADHYLGGSQDEWDVMKTRTRPHRVEALDGKPDAWEALFNAATTGFSTDAAYYAVQGLNSSGNHDPAGEDLVEIDNLIDYMLNIFYTGQTDGPVNPSANVPKNFFAMRRRDNSDGFRFFIHDNEDSLNSTTTNNTGSNPTGDRLTHFNPKWLHQKLSANALYRRAFGDRVHKHLFNNGALTPNSAAETFRLTSDALTKAIIGESARWGDYKIASPYTQATWQNAINGKLNSWIPGRPNVLLNQLRNIDLYP
ncbi:MAG: CotH kinase family protein, partial [Akkermansiaceae bacterium]